VNVFSAPRTVAKGDALTPDEIVARLRRAGFTTSRGNPLGWYNVKPDAVEIFPGKDAPAGSEPGVLEFSGGDVTRIVSLDDHTERNRLQLDSRLLASISENREKRRLVRFADIPPALISAVVSVEDKRFFQHSGVDLFRILKAAYVDLKDGKKRQGASTLSMQLARGLWLSPEKNWGRKFEEVAIAIQLEQRLSKQEIFEHYANLVYLGRRGTFSLNGFGEGARAYFGKDLSQITLPEAALLAGLIQRPSYYNPYRFPDRARDRRNTVLALMRENGYLTTDEYARAAAAPLVIQPEQADSGGSQYFTDLVIAEAQNRLGERETPRYIYTTLDPDLQREAERAVASGMEALDKQLKKRKGIPPGQPQVALVALSPRTGEVRALVGGRGYAESQLNHAVAMRQPGSVFKPFVYAAALNTAVEGAGKIYTPATLMDDEPTSFYFNKEVYTPGNYGQHYMGEVTLRTALALSLNVATVELAEDVGYENVVAVARRAGLNDRIEATPAVALGSYDTWPLEIAGAYTVFANMGMRAAPSFISLMRSPTGKTIYQGKPDLRRALDPRVAFLATNLMEEVLNSGTGAGVRGRGFDLPAAGKTGTARDGWFAGFTSELLCVVWVGFDDNRDLKLEGARSALPIWTEFMKGAANLRDYRDAKPFRAPAGVSAVDICPDSGQLSGPSCPRSQTEYFIDGTEPVLQCELHGAGQTFADRVIELGPTAPAAAPAGSQQQRVAAH
jgi:penicillin-binding protein 1B